MTEHMTTRQFTDGQAYSIANALRSAAFRYGEFAAKNRIAGNPRLADQFDKQETEALEFAVVFENLEYFTVTAIAE